ncbi:MAG: cAMP-binding protein [Rhodobacteraceae bacterium]|nr:MAG: cAMP-binding protein [Paracoccaceae bacterium]|tara:strand:+ start:712 stop:1098 length:387 start_codon:yes stop_codon:yes gene_type:complete
MNELTGNLANFSKGDSIYSIDEKSDFVYLIHSGQVGIYSRHGLELGSLGEGEIFGEVGRVIGTLRTVNARAKTDCKVFLIEWAKINEKLESADPVLGAIIRGLANRIGDANELAEKHWQELSLYKSLK